MDFDVSLSMIGSKEMSWILSFAQIVLFIYPECLHQCDDSDNVLIENKVIQRWVATPIWSDSIVFNANSTVNVIAELSLTFGVNRP